MRTVTRHLMPPQVAEDTSSAGVEGNSRLTAATGALLTVLLLIEGVTILDIRGLITLHTAVGLVLIGPVLLKTVSTMYRFGRYYTGRAAYVRKGPPHPILRLIGPLVVVSTVALLGTGIGLLATHGSSGTWLTLHQGSFIVWVALMTVHFLGHLQEAATGTAREFRSHRGDPARRLMPVRMIAVAASLALGIGLAAAFTPPTSSWTLHRHFHDGQSAPLHRAG